MENDSIRSSGENTLVTIWIEGKLRNIAISRSAVEGFLKLSPHRGESCLTTIAASSSGRTSAS